MLHSPLSFLKTDIAMKELTLILYILVLQISLVPLAILASMGIPDEIKLNKNRKSLRFADKA